MSSLDQDTSLINDFLTEAGELIESLDAGLVRLESEPTNSELLDQVFRALHTIKGAASFLNLGALTSFAHAAEDALNCLRKGEAELNAGGMDALLRSVDVLRGMLEQVRAGETITPAPQELIDALHAVAKRPGADAPSEAASDAAVDPTDGNAGVGSGKPLVIPVQAEDILPFMVSDLRAAADTVRSAARALATPAERSQAAAKIAGPVDGLASTSDFFGIAALGGLVSLMRDIASCAPAVPEAGAPGLQDCAMTLAARLSEAADLLSRRIEPTWELEELAARIRAAEQGTTSTGPSDVHPNQTVAATEETPETDTPAATAGIVSRGESDSPKGPEAGASAGMDQTVRVEVTRLEALLNLVGEMVLTKNQILGQARLLRGHDLPHDLLEAMAAATGDLDRLTGELQVGVMRTRMQPLSKLFGRYPRIIRDLARTTGKQIRLDIEGGETEVDKSVLEAMADPMVHILRNAADHGLEKPEGRAKSGKPPVGVIRLRAEHLGGHVRVEISDDGRGIDPQVIGAKAIEKGLITPDALAQMTQSDILKLIFAPGFSTAETVSDLSGRGVGMDVVNTNITKLGGSVNVDSTVGRGTRIEIAIPLTVAILPAMMVGVGRHDYAIPIAGIVEIVRLSDSGASTVAGRPVFRLRETVLPLIDLAGRLLEHEGDGTTPSKRFVVVVEAGQHRAGLVVEKLIGQQEVVIKPLDDSYAAGGPFSGATICEDGHVSLILDVIQLVRSAQEQRARLA